MMRHCQLDILIAKVCRLKHWLAGLIQGPTPVADDWSSGRSGQNPPGGRGQLHECSCECTAVDPNIVLTLQNDPSLRASLQPHYSTTYSSVVAEQSNPLPPSHTQRAKTEQAMHSRCGAFVGAVGMGRLPLARLVPGGGLSTLQRGGVWTQHAARRTSYLHVARGGRTEVVGLARAMQQKTEWNVVKVLENREVCEGHRMLVLDVGVTGELGSLCDSYRVPGMYVKLRSGEGGKVGFFAISCAPNLQGVFEFLIKDGEGTAWIGELRQGGVVEISPVMGKGFGVGKVAVGDGVLDVLLFATGSGIAPIRAAIESQLNGVVVRGRRKVRLFYGCRNEERMAYRERFALWEEDGVEVIPVMSREDDAWGGRRGYVQDVLREVGVDSPAETGALLCGVKGMGEEVTALLKEAGVRDDRILFNF